MTAVVELTCIPGGRETVASARLWWGYQRADGFIYCGRFYGGGRLTAAQRLGHTVRGPFIAADVKHGRDVLRNKLTELRDKYAKAPQKLLTYAP